VAASPYRDRMVLKGGILLYLMTRAWNRPTEDLDILVQDVPGESMAQVLEEILSLDLGDGLAFAADGMKAELIREDTGYPCQRFTIPCQFGPRFSQVIKLDLSFGDPVTPGPRPIAVVPLLDDFQTVQVLGYPIETVIAEKVETILSRGFATTRAKDLFDLWVVARIWSGLRLEAVSAALMATVSCREKMAARTASLLDLDAPALQAAYGDDPGLTRIWNAFVTSKRIMAPSHAEVVAQIQALVRPIVRHCLETAPDAEWNRALQQWA
jgi:hypothetical protein